MWLLKPLLYAAVLIIVSRYFPNIEQSVISQSTIARLLIEQFSLLMALLFEEFGFIHNFSSKSI